MKDEVNEVIKLSVNVHFLAAIAAILMLLLFIGRQFANDASLLASDLVGSAKVGILEDMRDSENVMPAAALYNILRTYDSSISEYYCRCSVHNGSRVGPYDLSSGTTPCVLLHLTGRVSVCVETAASSGYAITVHDADCDWFNGHCTCS